MKFWQCWDASHIPLAKPLYLVHSLESERVGWGPNLMFLSLHYVPPSSFLHSENPLSILFLESSWSSLTPSSPTSIYQQIIKWSSGVCLINIPSLACSLPLLVWPSFRPPSLIASGTMTASQLTFFPASRLTSSIQTPFYRANFLKNKWDPVTLVVETFIICFSFPNLVNHVLLP